MMPQMTNNNGISIKVDVDYYASKSPIAIIIVFHATYQGRKDYRPKEKIRFGIGKGWTCSESFPRDIPLVMNRSHR